MSPVLPREERDAQAVAIVRAEVASYDAVTSPERGTPESLSSADADLPEQIIARLRLAGLLADPDALDAAEEETEVLRRDAVRQARRADAWRADARMAEAERDAARAEVAALREALTRHRDMLLTLPIDAMSDLTISRLNRLLDNQPSGDRSATLMDRLKHIVDRYGDAHDAKDCAVLHDLRALAADEGERTGR